MSNPASDRALLFGVVSIMESLDSDTVDMLCPRIADGGPSLVGALEDVC